MAGVEADPDPVVAAGGLDQPGELAEAAAQRAARAGGVLEVDGAGLGLVERLPDDLPGALDRARDVAGLGAAGMQDDGGGAELFSGA